MEVSHQEKHFVLVHGACHGAWCWFKVKPLLEAAGHRVTALDMSASGINPKQIDELRTLQDYSMPLIKFMESVPADGRVILVGHSLGGFNLALAMEMYPDKISVAIFTTALMPDTLHRRSYVLDQYFKRVPADHLLDTEFKTVCSPGDRPFNSMLFGPKFVSSRLYQLCSAEDLALATTLLRPSSLFTEDLSAEAIRFSDEGYGSVKRAYVVCVED